MWSPYPRLHGSHASLSIDCPGTSQKMALCQGRLAKGHVTVPVTFLKSTMLPS